MAGDIKDADVSETLDELAKYLRKNRNHLAKGLARQLNNKDNVFDIGRIFCENEDFDIKIEIYKKRRKKK